MIRFVYVILYVDDLYLIMWLDNHNYGVTTGEALSTTAAARPVVQSW